MRIKRNSRISSSVKGAFDIEEGREKPYLINKEKPGGMDKNDLVMSEDNQQSGGHLKKMFENIKPLTPQQVRFILEKEYSLNTEEKRAEYNNNNKPFTTSNAREITDLYHSEQISYSRMVELLNECALKWLNETILTP